ncbi:MAG: DUF4166 domain-containing protein [Halioglobus sp.]
MTSGKSNSKEGNVDEHIASVEAEFLRRDTGKGSFDPTRPSLFQLALNTQWPMLPEEIKRLHRGQRTDRFSGVANVTRGTSPAAIFLGWCFRFPPAGQNIPVTITKIRTRRGELWVRNFDGKVLKSSCVPSTVANHYIERFPGFSFELELTAEDRCLCLSVIRGWIFGLRLPRLLLPQSRIKEYVVGGLFRFDVALAAPLGVGLLVHYRGYLEPAGDTG